MELKVLTPLLCGVKDSFGSRFSLPVPLTESPLQVLRDVIGYVVERVPEIHADFFSSFQGLVAKVFDIPTRSSAGLRSKKQGNARANDEAREKADDEIRFLTLKSHCFLPWCELSSLIIDTP
jgi:hypothetical protein